MSPYRLECELDFLNGFESRQLSWARDETNTRNGDRTMRRMHFSHDQSDGEGVKKRAHPDN